MALFVDNKTDTKSEQFSMQDVNLPEDNYNRVIQQQDVNVSDLGVSDERD